jgi:hypothetical protein
MGVRQGVAMDSLKFYLGPPCLTLLRPAVGPPLKRPYGRFRGHPQPGRHAAVFYLFGHPTPYTYDKNLPFVVFLVRYFPSQCWPVKWLCGLISLTGIIFVLIAKDHYTLDCVVAYYVTTRWTKVGRQQKHAFIGSPPDFVTRRYRDDILLQEFLLHVAMLWYGHIWVKHLWFQNHLAIWNFVNIS